MACQQQVRISHLFLTALFYSGSLPSYIIQSSPYTQPQFLIVWVHFLVASNVARYKDFKSALSLGNTLRCLLSLRYVELRDSMAFVVYITFLTVGENLNIGVITSQLSYGTFQQKSTKEKPQRLCDLHGYGKYKFCCMEIVLPLSR